MYNMLILMLFIVCTSQTYTKSTRIHGLFWLAGNCYIYCITGKYGYWNFATKTCKMFVVYQWTAKKHVFLQQNVVKIFVTPSGND